MERITTKDYKKLIKFHVENCHTVLISGAPGIGKSAILKGMQYNEKIKHPSEETLGENWVVLEERLYNRGEYAVGIPSIKTDENGTEITIWTQPEWILNIDKLQKSGKKVCLLLDDLHCLPEELQKPLYQFFESYELNGFKVEPLPIIILGNYNVDNLSMRAELESPIMGRLHGYYQLVPDFADWASCVDVHPKILHYFAQNRSAGKFYTENPENTTMYSSPRTIKKASDLYSAGHPLKEGCFSSILGESVGKELTSQWKHLGMTLNEMLTASTDPIESVVKCIMLAREAKITEGETNYIKLLTKATKIFGMELSFNFHVSSFRKFMKTPEGSNYVDSLFEDYASYNAAVGTKNKPNLKILNKHTKEEIDTFLEVCKFQLDFSKKNC